MKKAQNFGARTPEVSERETRHRFLARTAAAEGMVLLQNNGVLPLKTDKIALYGPGGRMTVKGGSGSGEVRERKSVNVEEGLRNAGILLPTTLWMDRFAEKYQRDIAAWRAMVEEKIKGYSPLRTMDMFIEKDKYPCPNPECTPILPDELTEETDTAVYVLSRQAGENFDRRAEPGSYFLSDVEKESLKVLSRHYARLILVINCGSVMDLSILEETRIDAVVLMGQAGMEGGSALADLLLGKVNFSGRLTDTWAYRYEDYPCADTFGHRNGNLEDEDYKEGIYVGYRWFDSFGITPRYPFGYGLSYTEFSHRFESIVCDGSMVAVTAAVSNVGAVSGKEVLQLYAGKPGKTVDCEKKSLCAFAKTSELKPGAAEKTELAFDLRDLAIYDEAKGCFCLEAGEYPLYLGNSAANAQPVAVARLEQEWVTEIAEPIPGKKCGFRDAVPKYDRAVTGGLPCVAVSAAETMRHCARKEAQSLKVRPLLQKLTDEEKVQLVVGGGYPIRCYNNVMGAAGRTCTGLLKKGIPNIVLADGPAGLNVLPVIGVGKEGFPRYPDGLPEDWSWGWLKGIRKMLRKISKNSTRLYRYMTAWPSETVQAQSWNTDLLEHIGEAIGTEMLEIGVSVWLAPGLNIHRNPLCGRNFEYYSEDPLISGKMAAAVTRGIQSRGGVGVSIKHFCCNNQEDNRMKVSSNLSQRALREIYLRGFRIAVTEGKPWTVMSSYNRVNGQYVCNSRSLLTGVLRDEWGFDGVVMSDWNATEQCSYAEAINAGNDLIMPGTKQVCKKLSTDPALNKSALNTSAGRILKLIFMSDTCKEF